LNTAQNAAFYSWALDWRVIRLLLTTALVYVRGWTLARRLSRHEQDYVRLAAFLSGLMAIFLATESPLDVFDSLYLSAHMTQHLLLMMIAPPLLLLGHPTVPLLRGLPRSFVKEGLGPFLSWPSLRAVLRWLTFPPVAFVMFAVSTLVWHAPALYELALHHRAWHGVQHACFFWTGILFWWPVILPAHGPRSWPRWTAIPYLLLADGLNTAISAFLIFSDRLLYPSYELVRASSMTAREDQAAAGAIMWVPGSIAYLVPAIVIAMQQFSGARGQHVRNVPSLIQINAYAPIRKRWRLQAMRRAAQVAMLLVAIAVMADGFTGTQIAPLNLAGALPWIHWRGLSIVALLLIGNLFCMACPFTLVRDWGRLVFPASSRWPRPLRNKWLPVGLIVLYLWAYEAFSLWNNPWLTAWIIAAYFTAALLIDGMFKGASFCKYVCPIGQFHFVNSMVSPGEIRVRDLSVCQSCQTYDCIRGNDRTRGCELHLFQPKKAGNMDCTFCLDCVKACPHDNVGLMPTAPAATLTVDPYRSSLGRLSKRTDIATLALVIVFGAFVNAAGMVEPVMMWEHGWHARLGQHMMPAIVATFVIGGVCLAPAISIIFCVAWNRLVQGPLATADIVRRLVLALVPVGVAMWAAHLLYHLATVWLASVPGWITPMQLMLLDAGLLLTLYVSWRIARQCFVETGKAMGLVTPWALLSCALYAVGVWILFQPMQMRGTM
jgi:cytochrome c oxidase assembly factor CtaG/ferredoxin